MSCVRMNHRNNVRLRQLLEASGLKQGAALEAFNRGQLRPISMSYWKAWFASPDSVRWRVLPDAYLKHAETVFSKPLDSESLSSVT